MLPSLRCPSGRHGRHLPLRYRVGARRHRGSSSGDRAARRITHCTSSVLSIVAGNFASVAPVPRDVRDRTPAIRTPSGEDARKRPAQRRSVGPVRDILNGEPAGPRPAGGRVVVLQRTRASGAVAPQPRTLAASPCSQPVAAERPAGVRRRSRRGPCPDRRRARICGRAPGPCAASGSCAGRRPDARRVFACRAMPSGPRLWTGRRVLPPTLPPDCRLLKHPRLWQGPPRIQGRRSSVVERTLGKGEVLSSILSGGTIRLPKCSPDMSANAAASRLFLLVAEGARASNPVSRQPGPRSPTAGRRVDCLPDGAVRGCPVSSASSAFDGRARSRKGRQGWLCTFRRRSSQRVRQPSRAPSTSGASPDCSCSSRRACTISPATTPSGSASFNACGWDATENLFS